MDISAMSPEMIPALSTAMSTAKVQTEVGVSVLAKTLDITDAASAAMLDMMRKSMELSVNPAVGSNFDVSV